MDELETTSPEVATEGEDHGTVTVTLSQEDLDNNPGLEEAGAAVGDEVELPVEATAEEAEAEAEARPGVPAEAEQGEQIPDRNTI